MDPESAKLALRLQLNDIEGYRKALPSSTKDATAFSEAKAFEELRNELLKKLWEVNGQCAAMNLLREEHENQVAFQRLMVEERQSESDHDMACRLAGMRVATRPAAAVNNQLGNADAIRRMNALNGAGAGLGMRVNLDGTQTGAAFPDPGKHPAYHDAATLRERADGRTKRRKTGEGSEDHPTGGDEIKSAADNSESSVPDDGKGKGKTCAATHAMCSSCFDLYPKFDVLQLSCKNPEEFDTHAYCRECLQGFFESCISDSSNFPPRCCSKIIPLFSCVPFLSKILIERFVERRDELDTVNRTYCCDPQCAKWIKPEHIKADVATCPDCSQTTCTSCKGKPHEGLCAEDQHVKQLMGLAQENKWKTCPECKNMVELAKGCYHITCRCHYQFCYLCLARWKTCRCDHWDENNIWDGVRAGNNAPAVNNNNAQQGNQARVQQGNQARVQQGNQARVPPPAPAPAANPAPMQIQNANANVNANNRPPARRAFQPHRHTWAKLYAKDYEDTECDDCRDELEWILYCDGCDTRFCLRCKEHAGWRTKA